MQSDKPKYIPGSITQSQLEEVKRKVEHTNVFPLALQRAGFSKLDEVTYAKGENEKIRIYCQNGKWQYQNLKNISDKGSVIDFINRRLPAKDKSSQEEKWNLDFSTIAALDYYNIQLKEEKKKATISLARELDNKMKVAAENRKQAINKNLGL